MSTMRDLEKLRVLLDHWVGHNREHAEEFRQWAGRAEQLGVREVASNLGAAVEELKSVNKWLVAALDKLGGPTEHQE